MTNPNHRYADDDVRLWMNLKKNQSCMSYNAFIKALNDRLTDGQIKNFWGEDSFLFQEAKGRFSAIWDRYKARSVNPVGHFIRDLWDNVREGHFADQGQSNFLYTWIWLILANNYAISGTGCVVAFGPVPGSSAFNPKKATIQFKADSFFVRPGGLLSSTQTDISPDTYTKICASSALFSSRNTSCWAYRAIAMPDGHPMCTECNVGVPDEDQLIDGICPLFYNTCDFARLVQEDTPWALNDDGLVQFKKIQQNEVPYAQKGVVFESDADVNFKVISDDDDTDKNLYLLLKGDRWCEVDSNQVKKAFRSGPLVLSHSDYENMLDPQKRATIARWASMASSQFKVLLPSRSPTPTSKKSFFSY